MTPSENLENKIIMQGIHIELTEAMKNAIREKLEVLLRHDARIIRINVRLHKDQTMGHERHFTATAQVEVGGPDIVASADGKDAYAAIDELADVLDRQLERRHDRRKDKRNHPHEVELDANLPKVE
jgi:putative sigma-54 modulation protein